MTLTITSLIEKYSDMTSDDVLSHPDLGRDIETIGTIMNDATTTEVDKATAFLSDLSNNITAEITTLRSMQSDGLECFYHLHFMHPLMDYAPANPKSTCCRQTSRTRIRRVTHVKKPALITFTPTIKSMPMAAQSKQ
jgi:hypothetical protein